MPLTKSMDKNIDKKNKIHCVNGSKLHESTHLAKETQPAVCSEARGKKSRLGGYLPQLGKYLMNPHGS